MTLTAWAASTPLPVEGGELLDVCLTTEGGAIHVAWCHEGGRRKEPDGPAAASWAEASRAYAIIDARRRALAP